MQNKPIPNNFDFYKAVADFITETPEHIHRWPDGTEKFVFQPCDWPPQPEVALTCANHFELFKDWVVERVIAGEYRNIARYDEKMQRVQVVNPFTGDGLWTLYQMFCEEEKMSERARSDWRTQLRQTDGTEWNVLWKNKGKSVTFKHGCDNGRGTGGREEEEREEEAREEEATALQDPSSSKRHSKRLRRDVPGTNISVVPARPAEGVHRLPGYARQSTLMS